jgi:hypothetical protein
MADEHDPQQQSSFHWPPTAEELDTIQVVDMQGQPLPLPGTHRHWRTGVAKASIAQLGVLAGSLAAIGIALTSMLAHPAQPTTRAARGQASVAVADKAPSPPQVAERAAASTPSVDDSAAFVADAGPAFRPMVTLDIEKPSPADVRPQSPVKNREARVQLASAQPRPARVTRVAERRFAKREAPRDPVAKFAVHTGLSVWKAMRVVGRTLKHQGDEEYFATRSAGARRTAKAAGLQAENAPSDR